MGKVGKFTVEVDQLAEQLISFLQEESWLTQSDEELLRNGFFKVAQFCFSSFNYETHRRQKTMACWRMSSTWKATSTEVAPRTRSRVWNPETVSGWTNLLLPRGWELLYRFILFPFPFCKVLSLFKSDTNFIIGNCSEEPGAAKRNCSHFPGRLDYEALVGWWAGFSRSCSAGGNDLTS